MMVKNNLIGKEGTIIDATIGETPIQHNSKDENEQIKNTCESRACIWFYDKYNERYLVRTIGTENEK